MNPFKTDNAKKLDRDLDTARAALAKLAARHAAAESAILERRAEAQSLARDGADDGMLDIAEAALRGAQDRVVTLAAALADTKQQVVTLERVRAELADKKLRLETAAALDELAEELGRAGAAFDTGATQLVDINYRIAPIILDAHGLQAFAMNARAEVPAAVEMIARLLRERAAATLAGTAPAKLQTVAPEPAAAPPPPVPETERVFLQRHVKWTDTAGAVHLGQQYTDADLPRTVAARALKTGAAVPMAHPTRKKNHNSRPPRIPELSWCESLDADTGRSVVEPVKHSAFERVDRGPSYSIRVPRGAAS